MDCHVAPLFDTESTGIHAFVLNILSYTILVDCGLVYPFESYLKTYDNIIQQIDVIILTSAAPEHSAALPYILKHLPSDSETKVYFPDTNLSALKFSIKHAYFSVRHDLLGNEPLGNFLSMSLREIEGLISPKLINLRQPGIQTSLFGQVTGECFQTGVVDYTWLLTVSDFSETMLLISPALTVSVDADVYAFIRTRMAVASADLKLPRQLVNIEVALTRSSLMQQDAMLSKTRDAFSCAHILLLSPQKKLRPAARGSERLDLYSLTRLLGSVFSPHAGADADADAGASAPAPADHDHDPGHGHSHGRGRSFAPQSVVIAADHLRGTLQVLILLRQALANIQALPYAASGAAAEHAGPHRRDVDVYLVMHASAAQEIEPLLHAITHPGGADAGMKVLVTSAVEKATSEVGAHRVIVLPEPAFLSGPAKSLALSGFLARSSTHVVFTALHGASLLTRGSLLRQVIAAQMRARVRGPAAAAVAAAPEPRRAVRVRLPVYAIQEVARRKRALHGKADGAHANDDSDLSDAAEADSAGAGANAFEEAQHGIPLEYFLSNVKLSALQTLCEECRTNPDFSVAFGAVLGEKYALSDQKTLRQIDFFVRTGSSSRGEVARGLDYLSLGADVVSVVLQYVVYKLHGLRCASIIVGNNTECVARRLPLPASNLSSVLTQAPAAAPRLNKASKLFADVHTDAAAGGLATDILFVQGVCPELFRSNTRNSPTNIEEKVIHTLILLSYMLLRFYDVAYDVTNCLLTISRRSQADIDSLVSGYTLARLSSPSLRAPAGQRPHGVGEEHPAGAGAGAAQPAAASRASSFALLSKAVAQRHVFDEMPMINQDLVCKSHCTLETDFLKYFSTQASSIKEGDPQQLGGVARQGIAGADASYVPGAFGLARQRSTLLTFLDRGEALPEDGLAPRIYGVLGEAEAPVALGQVHLMPLEAYLADFDDVSRIIVGAPKYVISTGASFTTSVAALQQLLRLSSVSEPFSFTLRESSLRAVLPATETPAWINCGAKQVFFSAVRLTKTAGSEGAESAAGAVGAAGAAGKGGPGKEEISLEFVSDVGYNKPELGRSVDLPPSTITFNRGAPPLAAPASLSPEYAALLLRTEEVE